jgi:hypothetical protein
LELGKADGKLRKQLALILAGFVISFYEFGFFIEKIRDTSFITFLFGRVTN